MADFGYNWDDKDVVRWSTRNMPVVLLKRLKVVAARLDHSREFTLNMALDIGLTRLEKEANGNG